MPDPASSVHVTEAKRYDHPPPPACEWVTDPICPDPVEVAVEFSTVTDGRKVIHTHGLYCIAHSSLAIARWESSSPS